jgi:hypothetical protein
MKNFILKSTLLLFLFFSINTNAQVEEIQLTNPSFEDFPRPGQQPRGWFDCGDINFPLQTAPDVHPSMVNGIPIFGVTQQSYHGNTYLGMVHRENGSYESVAQRLKSRLLMGNIYSFTLSLCTSENYESAIRKGENIVDTDFTTPVFLRIWGGIGFCGKQELLAQSPVIDNLGWKEFTFFLEPKSEDISYIVLEVASDELVNGNLLIDNASSIRMENIESMNTGELSLIREQMKSRNDSLGVISKIQRLAETEIKIKGYDIRFKDNKLTVSGNRKMRSIANAMKEMSDYKLIIDLNGLKKKKAKIRKINIETVLLQEGLPWMKFEIRNTKEEDNSVKWLVDEEKMFVGIIKVN